MDKQTQQAVWQALIGFAFTAGILFWLLGFATVEPLFGIDPWKGLYLGLGSLVTALALSRHPLLAAYLSVMLFGANVARQNYVAWGSATWIYAITASVCSVALMLLIVGVFLRDSDMLGARRRFWDCQLAVELFAPPSRLDLWIDAGVIGLASASGFLVYFVWASWPWAVGVFVSIYLAYRVRLLMLGGLSDTSQ